MSGKRRSRSPILGKQHPRRDPGAAEPVPVRAVRALGEVHVRAPADVLPGRVSLRAAVPPAQAPSVRPEQRVPRHLLRLVQVPVLLRLQVLQHARRVPRHLAQPPRQGPALARVVQEEVSRQQAGKLEHRPTGAVVNI